MVAIVIESVSVSPGGTFTQYSAVIGSLSKISGAQHTTLGSSFPRNVKINLAPVLLGRFTPPLNGHLDHLDAGFRASRAASTRDDRFGKLLTASVTSRTRRRQSHSQSPRPAVGPSLRPHTSCRGSTAAARGRANSFRHGICPFPSFASGPSTTSACSVSHCRF